MGIDRYSGGLISGTDITGVVVARSEPPAATRKGEKRYIVLWKRGYQEMFSTISAASPEDAAKSYLRQAAEGTVAHVLSWDAFLTAAEAYRLTITATLTAVKDE